MICFRYAWVVLLGGALLLGLGCSEAPLLALKVVTPEGPDPLAGATQLRLSLSSPAGETTMVLDDPTHFQLELELEVAGEIGTITLEGLAGDQLVARGESPPLVLLPEERQLSLLVAPAGAFSLLPPRMEGGSREIISVLVPSWGLIFLGGLDEADHPRGTVHWYDFYQHELHQLADLPRPRAAAVGAACRSTCLVLACGIDDAGLSSELLRFDGSTWTSYPDQLDPTERRREASIAQLDADRYLIIGGAGATGALDTVLELTVGDLLTAPQLAVFPATTNAARVRPALANGKGAILVAGGQSKGFPPVEILGGAASTFKVLSLPGPALQGGSAAADLEDGRLILVGGQDESGALLADAWIIDPTTLQVEHHERVLREGRAVHQVMRLGQQLIVVGGQQEQGLAAQVEIIELDALLESDGEAQTGTAALVTPRSGFALGRLGQGSFLIVGGSGNADNALPNTLELYETSQLLEP